MAYAPPNAVTQRQESRQDPLPGWPPVSTDDTERYDYLQPWKSIMPTPPATAPNAAQRILTVATDLFYRQGVRAVGVEEIVLTAATTKPSLYRAFGSKDQLIVAYLEAQAARMWVDLETAITANTGDPGAQILACFDALAAPATEPSDRGCALSNAVVEFPDPKHPGRIVAVGHKERVRKRLRDLAREMDARKPRKLADSLLLLIEGARLTRQIYGKDGPAEAARGAAEILMRAHTRRPAAETT